MSPSILRRRSPRPARTPIDPAAAARRKARRAGRPGLEALESRIVMDADFYVGGLDFHAVGVTSWNSSLPNNEVEIGLKPSGSPLPSFTPLLDIPAGSGFQFTDATHFSVSGTTAKITTYATKTQTATALFSGAHTFNVDSGSVATSFSAVAPTPTTTAFKLGGSSMTATKVDLAGNSVKVYGSSLIVPIPGVTLSFDSTNPVTVASVPNTANAPAVNVSAVVPLPDSPKPSVGGVGFDLSGLDVGYLPAANNGSGAFFVDGTATATVASLGSFSVILGSDATHHGIVFDTSTVSAVNATVATTAQLTIGGLTLTPNTLAFSYQKGGAISFSGGVTASEQGGPALGLNLGMTLDSSGHIASFSGQVDGYFGFSDIFVVQPVGLTVTYDDPTSTFSIYGGVNVTVVSAHFQSIQATLGNAKSPGLKIVKGNLQSLDITLSSAFDLFGVTVTPTNLHLKYSAPPNKDTTLSLSGDLRADFTGTIGIDGGIDPNLPLTIDLTTKTVDLSHGFGVHLAGDFKGFSLDATVSFQQEKDLSYDVLTKGTLTTPGGIGFNAYLNMVNGTLADIGVGISSKIAVGDTGVFITWVYGSLNNLDTDDPTITAAATLVYGSDDILRVTGAVEINKEHLLVSADAANPPAIYTSKQVSATDHPLGVFVLDGAIGQLGGSLDLDWGSGVYSVHASGNLLDGLATIDVGMTLSSSGNLSFSADVGIGIPQEIPIIGGMKLLGGHVRLEYKNHDLNDSYVAAWGDFFGGLVTAGVEYNFGTHDFSFLDASAVSQLNTSQNQTVAAPHVTFTTTVPNDTGSVQFVLSDPYLDKTFPNNDFANSPQLYDVKVLGPGGYVADYSLDYGASPTIANGLDLPVPSVDPLAPNARYPNTARVLTILPAPGQRTLKTGTYTITFTATEGNIPPANAVMNAAKGHFSPQPLAPTFGYLFANGSYSPSTYTEAAPVATQVDSDKIEVKVPVDSYNPASPYTVSLYATDTPLPAGVDPSNPVAVLDANGAPVLDANGKPLLISATLVDRRQVAFNDPNLNDLDATDAHHSHYLYDDTVLASQLGKLPDGNTPAYFYVVVSDGLNHPHFSAASNPVTLPSPAPAINLTAADIVTDFKSPYTFAGYFNGAGVTFPIDAPNATSVRITAGDGTILFPLPGGPDDNQELRYDEITKQIVYTPPASGIPAAGYDTVTVTAYNQIPGEASPYVTSRVITLLPPNNVDLSVSQLDYGSASGTLASTYGASLGSRPITEGETVTIHLAARATPTPAGGASTARGVTVKFPIPAGLTYVSASGQGSYDPTTGIWTIGNLTPSALPAGQGQAWINLTVKVNAGTAGTILASTATAAPGTNADGTPQPDINLSNVQSTTSFYVGSAITGQVVMVDSSPQSVDTTPHPAAGITVYELAANVADNAEYLLAAATTDANGRYAFSTSSSPSSSYPVIHIRIYGVSDTSQVAADYTVGSVPSFRVTTIQPATISGTLQHERYPSFAGDTGKAPGFSAKSGGLVYLDLNNDGTWEANEPSATSDATGHFVFSDVVPGTYAVRELIKPGRVAANSDGSSGSDARSVRVTAGQTDNTSSFYYIDQITLQGHVFNDTNGNAVFDQGEPGLANWIVDLDRYQGDPNTNNYDPNNVQLWWWGIQTSVTDAAGKYHFDNLSPGIYRIRQRQVTYPGGPWTSTVADAGVGPDNFIEVTQSGDVLVLTLFSGYGERRFEPIKDIQANHLSHIDFGNKVAATPQAMVLGAGPRALVSGAAAGDLLHVTAPNEVQAGEVSQFTVTAIGPDGNPDPNFTGTVDLGSSDDSALLDTTYTFQPSDSGSHTFGFTLFTVGTATVDAAIDGDAGSQAASDPIAVHAGLAADCLITAPAAIAPGQPFDLEIHPVDHAGNTDVNYWGDADITTSLSVNGVVLDPSTLPAAVQAWLAANAGLPQTYHFTLQDQGDHTFQVNAPALDPATIAAIPGMSGPNPGSLGLVVQINDPTGAISPADVTIPVTVSAPAPAPAPTPTSTVPPTPSPLPAASPTMALSIQGPTQVVAGLPVLIEVAASSLPGRTADAAPHAVRLLSTDPLASLPAGAVLIPGGPRQDLTVTFARAGAQTLAIVDAATGAVLGRMTVDVQAAPASAPARTVDAIFQALLGHPADAQALSTWGGRLSRGVPASRLARALIGSRAYAESQVAEVYRTLLGRAPSAAERNLAVARLREGGSIRRIERGILGGSEYNRLHGGEPSGFLAAAAQDILGRALTPVEQSKYAAELARGASRASVARSLLKSPAALNARAVQLYQEVLGRAPSAHEGDRAAALLRTGRLASLTAQLIDSAEFRAMASGQAAPAPAAGTVKSRPSRPVITDGRAHPIARFVARPLAAMVG